MPELPDVEVYRRYLSSTALHQRIDHTRVCSPGVLAGTSPQALGRALKGAAIEDTRRHGKFLFARADAGRWLVLHFGMTGRLYYSRKGEDPPEHTACLFGFANGAILAYISPRKLGRIGLTGSADSYIASQGLGPDALEIDEAEFLARAEDRRGGVKSWLMDQESLAGIGNVYSDEILFQAGLHPRLGVKDLGHDRLRRLYRSVSAVLAAAIKARADPARMPSDFLLPHRHEEGRCPRCGAGVKKIRAAGRTAWYCPHCQST